MSVFSSVGFRQDYKVRNSDYIHTENRAEGDDPKPAEPASPQPKAE